MLNHVRIDHLGHSGRCYLASSTRWLLAKLDQAHESFAPPKGGKKSLFVTLNHVLLESLTKVASARPYSSLTYLESLLLKTALGAALKAAQSHQESNAILGLQRLLRAIPAMRATLCRREQAARLFIKVLVTSNGLLTLIVKAETFGVNAEAA